MSAPEEYGQPVVEARSKIKVTRNAKGDPQWELSVVAGETEEEMTRIRKLAVAQHLALLAELLGPALGTREAAA